MAPIVPDGVYKIYNAKYSEYVADLINGVPEGPISAYKESPSNANDKWIVENKGSGGNQITLQSVSVPTNYATASQFQPGAGLVGSTSPEVWTIVKLDGDNVAIQGPINVGDVWVLPEGNSYVQIKLKSPTGQDDAKWKFVPLSG